MLFIKAGTLREALGLARDEKMLDGQDPLVVMNGCSEARMSAPVMVEIEVSGGKDGLLVETVPAVSQAASFVSEEPRIPCLLKMYVCVQSPPFKRNDQKEWYVFARRVPREQSLSGFRARLSERRLNFVMNVR
jgi:hypothetical protein